jgi:hypothetical protein
MRVFRVRHNDIREWQAQQYKVPVQDSFKDIVYRDVSFETAVGQN